MACRTYATLGGPTWNPRALLFSLLSLADEYYSRCRLTDAQWRGRKASTDMLAPALPIQTTVLSPPLPQGSLLAHVKLDEHLGSLDLSCRVVSEQSAPTLRCSMPLFHSSRKVLNFALLNFPRFSPSHFPCLSSATSQACPPADQLLPKREMELTSLQA